MTDDDGIRPTGWMAQLPPEAQREIMQRMLVLHAASQPMKDAAEVAMMALQNADALDAQAFIQGLRASAVGARRQAELLEEQARQYEAMMEVIDRWR